MFQKKKKKKTELKINAKRPHGCEKTGKLGPDLGSASLVLQFKCLG